MNPNPKNFTPEGVQKSETAAREESLLQFWKENNIFEKTLAKESPMGDFIFFEGPPTANGRPGFHHVEARSFKDIIPRYKTMRGFYVQRRAGWDTHGLPVELQVEKQLGLTSKRDIETYGVAAYNKKCRESVWEYKDEWEALTDRMGYWLNMEHPYITYDNGYIESLWGIVKKISERKDQNGNDLMYKDFKILPWCTRCGTALSSHELNQPGAYQDVKDVTAYVKFKVIPGQKIGNFVADENTYIMAWTTTPWTLPGNVALAVGGEIEYLEVDIPESFNPNNFDLGNFHIPSGKYIFAKSAGLRPGSLDEFHKLVWLTKDKNVESRTIRGSELVGLKYEPLYPFMSDLLPADQQSKLEHAFQVYAADFVTTTDGTGIVHIAPMYGADDFNLANDHHLPKFHVVNEEGKYIAGCDTDTLQLSGRYVKESDASGKPTLAIDIINDLTAQGLLFKKENYAHSYPHCWRCNTPLLYYARGSWFFRMSSLREQLLTANEHINWEPDHIKSGRFGEWLDGIKDWAISRHRYWGTPLPVWESEDSSERQVIGSYDELKEYAGDRITKLILVRHGQATHNVFEISSSARDLHPLTELGQEQAHIAAERLAQEKIDVVFASPILRAKQTAEAYTTISGKEIIFDDRLGEITSGNWEETTQFDPTVKAMRDAYKALPVNERFVVKRGDTGESWQDLDLRVASFLDEILEKYAGKTITIFSHQGTQSSILKQLKKISNEEATNTIFHNDQATGNAVPVMIYVDTKEKTELDIHKPTIDNFTFEKNGKLLKRTAEVMDVWFDSGAMPYAQTHKVGDPVDFSPVPADYIAEAVDQTRGWFYTMHAIANLLNDQPTNNYKNVICLGLLMSSDGTKMSKSKGNIISPWEMFEKFGADVVRFWFYSVNQPGETKNFDEKSLDEVKKKVFNPLLNVVSFYEMYKGEVRNAHDSNNILDQWIMVLLAKLTAEVAEGLDSYTILEPARAIREFINELSTWYIRRSRDRFKSDDADDRNAAIATTRHVLLELSKIMAPFTPFVAEEIWQKLSNDGSSVHLQEFPKTSSFENDVLEKMEELRAIVSAGLEIRNNENIKVRQPLSLLKVKEMTLNPIYYWIILEELNVKKVEVDSSLGEKVWIDTEITDALRDEGDMRDLIRLIQDMRKDANLMPSDRVVVHLEITEPAWWSNDELNKELLTTVGAENIAWASNENRVEKE